MRTAARLEGVVEQVVQVGGQLGFVGLPVGVRPSRARWVPSSGTVRTWRARWWTWPPAEQDSRSSASPAPIRSRAASSAMPMPGWCRRAVIAQVRAARFWMSAGRSSRPVSGGPSWRRMPARMPGRSAWSTVVLGRGWVEGGGAGAPGGPPACVPMAWRARTPSHWAADQPRIGTVVSSATSIQAGDEDQEGDPAADRHGEPGRCRRGQQQGELGAGEAEEPAVPVAGGGSAVDAHARNTASSASPAAPPARPGTCRSGACCELDPGARAEAAGGLRAGLPRRGPPVGAGAAGALGGSGRCGRWSCVAACRRGAGPSGAAWRRSSRRSRCRLGR